MNRTQGIKQKQKKDCLVSDDDNRLPVFFISDSFYLSPGPVILASVFCPCRFHPCDGIVQLEMGGTEARGHPAGCMQYQTVKCFLSGCPDSPAAAGGSPAGETR